MFKIDNKKIGAKYKPFIIAEMSGNHNKSLKRALDLVDAAAKSGVDALKIQTYTPDTLTLDLEDGDFFIKEKNSLWKGQSLYKLYQNAHTPWDWHEAIFKRANELGIICFSSPFDDTAVDFLEDLNVPAYKIASFESSHLSLIKKVAATGKPIIISTGMANLGNLYETIKTLKDSQCKSYALLKCTSSYPASPKSSNIITIPHMRSLFDCEIGLSDHTMGIGAAVAAVAHGASIIEKHFTISRSDGGVDSTFSLEPVEMKNLVIETKRAWESLGDIYYGPTEKEKESIIFRRSLYIAEDMKKGETLNEVNLRVIRPGNGLAPKYFDIMIGRKVKKDLKKGTPLTWDLTK